MELERCRRDRRQLLDYILSSGLIKEIRTPSGPTTSHSNIDFDNLSADSVLESIRSGGVLDITKATKRGAEETTWPIMIHSQLGHSYFLLSDPESAGSPPRGTPPPIGANHAKIQNSLVGRRATVSEDDHGVKHTYTSPTSSKSVKNISIPSLGLPAIKTGF